MPFGRKDTEMGDIIIKIILRVMLFLLVITLISFPFLEKNSPEMIIGSVTIIICSIFIIFLIFKSIKKKK